MRKTEKIAGSLGDNIKDYVIQVLSRKLKHDAALSFNGYDFVITPDDTYDTVMSSFRKGFYKTMSFVKPQQNLDYMIEELPSIVLSLDDFLGWLRAYTFETISASIESHRWKVVQILTNTGYRPLNKNLSVCPKNLLSLELIVGVFMYQMGSKDYANSIIQSIDIFADTSQYQALKRTMDRQHTIDEILKTL